MREAVKFGIVAHVAGDQAQCDGDINVTNYQKLDHFDLSAFGGVILDESSILKSTEGHYRTRLIEACQSIPFRLAATATPAPNDFMELGNHAEFLGIMSYTDMLATFFTHDGGDTWLRSSEGLPQRDAYLGVLREALAVDRLNPVGVYFGDGPGVTRPDPADPLKLIVSSHAAADGSSGAPANAAALNAPNITFPFVPILMVE